MLTKITLYNNLVRLDKTCLKCAGGIFKTPSDKEICPICDRKRMEYIILNMRKRCYNPKNKGYKNYGGRGIKVCQEWMKLENFFNWAIRNGYESHLTIDRIDNNGNYEPSNCRWVTKKEQNQNTRDNINITAWNETKCVSEWVRDKRCQVGSYTAILYRIKIGCTPEEAISLPKQFRGGVLRKITS